MPCTPYCYATDIKPVNGGSAAAARRSVDLVADDLVGTADVRFPAVHEAVAAARVAGN